MKVPRLLLAASALVAGSCQPYTSPSPEPAHGALAPAYAEELAALRNVLDSTGFAGTVAVYDVRSDRLHTVYGEGVRRGRIPASTFKIFNTLLPLELGLVEDAGTVLPWDSVAHPRTELNRDFTLRDAFHVSAVPHYQELARRAGAERMQRWLDRVGYGNRNIGGGIDQFWLVGSLRISPLEQIEFLDRLRRGALPFSARTQELTREIMVATRTPDYVLRAKTGWARQESGSTGWWVGWVERGPDSYVFATVLDSPDPRANFGDQRQAVTRTVLRELGVLPDD